MSGIPAAITSRDQLHSTIDRIVAETPVVDMHTHLYTPAFGPLLLWGVDELVTYHYLIAEVLRTNRTVSPGEFWAMDLTERADHIWQTLFINECPISEARRGVLTTLKKLGIAPGPGALAEAREYCADTTAAQHIDKVFEVANVASVVMTNDPFDVEEHEVWLGDPEEDPRFKAALRIDTLLNSWHQACEKLQAWHYDVQPALDVGTLKEVRRFLGDWANRMDPLYLAASLPNDFAYPVDDARSRIINEALLPFCRERGLPFAMMVGVKRLINPDLKLAGDGVGKWDLATLENLCRENPDVKFLITVLARENQHELCVAARKYPNLLPFGCWWFLNNPSLIEEMTRMRIELLGFSMIPQHSDARILDQLVYKWTHSRAIIAKVLKEKYADLMDTGWPLDEARIQADVEAIFSGTLAGFVS